MVNLFQQEKEVLSLSDFIIETKNITKQYGEQKSVANLNIHIKKGRIYGLLGRNGAGKTTTMKMLLNLTRPTSGEVKIFGKSIQGNEKKILPRIGSLIESPGFYPNLTGTENLKIFAQLRGVSMRDAVSSALEVVGLPYRDKKLFSQYSLGMKQRLAIALAIMHDPELLILDEPINGLDPIGIAEVRSFIRELCDAKGKTILISSHILSEIALLVDDIGIIDQGVLLEEESLAELEEKNGKYIHFIVSDSAQAARIMERNFRVNNFTVENDHSLRLYDNNLSVAKLNRTFIESGLEVSEAHTCEDTLEDYFKRITGGEGIA
jgi:bacitracin transport system ATP-binding protein